MKSLILFLLLPFFSEPDCKHQVITIDPKTPITIDAYNKFDQADKGERKLTVNVKFTKKLEHEMTFKFDVNEQGLSSSPEIPGEVTIKPLDVEKGMAVITVTVKLKPVECPLTKEHFTFSMSSLSYRNGAGIKSAPITIDSIPLASPPTVRLLEETTVVTPFIRDAARDAGNRIVTVNLLLSGKRADARTQPFNFSVLANSSTSAPVVQGGNITVPQMAYSENGCPVVFPVTVMVKLTAVDSLPLEEQVYIQSAVADAAHAHKLIIKNAVKKDAAPKKPEKNSFSHACISGHNFLVSIKQDSTGNFVEVTEEKDKKPYQYHYNNYFHTADFASWLLNVFYKVIRTADCDNCSQCANYLAERVLEELAAMKNKAQEENKAVSKVSEDKAATKDSVPKAKAEADAAKAVASTEDTFNYKVAYGLTTYNLTVRKTKDGSFIKICTTDNLTCKEQEVTTLDKANFNAAVPYLLKQQTGDESLDNSKISPAPDQLFANYQKDYDKKHPKEKTQVEKDAMAALAALNADSTTHIKVGRIYLADTSGMLDIYSPSGKIIKQVKIDSITFSIEEGKIVRRSLMVYTPSGIFWNNMAPIAVRSINLRQEDRLNNLNKPGENFIKLGSVLRYQDNSSYVPDDVDMIVISPEKKSVNLTVANNLNSLVNFSLFTDLTGLLGRRANGLVNTDVSGKFITNTRNFKNKDITALSFIEANVLVSKFDNKFRSIDSGSITFDTVNTNSKRGNIDRMRLMQNAWLKASVKFNMFSFRTFSAQFFRINWGCRFNVVNADSLYKNEKEKEPDVLFFEYYHELAYSIKRINNFGMDLSLKWIIQVIADKERFANLKPISVFNPNVSFSYYPNGNPTKQVYLRFNYFAGRAKESNNFYQLQFGWKTGLKLK